MPRKSMSGAAETLVKLAEQRLREANKDLDQAKREPDTNVRNHKIAEAQAAIGRAEAELREARYHGRE